MVKNKYIRVTNLTSMHNWDDGRIFYRTCVGLATEGIFDISLVAVKGEYEIVNNVKIHAIKNQSKGLKRKILTSYLVFKKALRLNTDIYHFHDSVLLPWMILLKIRYPKRKIIYDIHENYRSNILKRNLPELVSRFLVKLYDSFENKSLSLFDAGVTVSLGLRSIFKNNVRDKIIIIRNVPFHKDFTYKRNGINKEISFIVSGINSKERNTENLIIAFGKTLKDYPYIKLKIAGRFTSIEYENELKGLVNNLGIKNNVIFEGMLPLKENYKRVANSDIGFVLYEDNINNRVGAPNRLFEYINSGLIVVGEDFTEIRKIINKGNCGILVNSSNIEKFSNSLKALLKDSLRMDEYKKNSLLYGKNELNFEKEKEKLKELYIDLYERKDT